MATNLAIEIDGFNLEDPAKAIRIVEKPIPEPADGEALVEITCRPVNPADVLSLRGVYAGFQPKKFPATPGLEGAGVVRKLGPGCSKVTVGQRVTGVPFPVHDGRGTWQTYVTVSEHNLLVVPEGVPDEFAAQFLVNPVTAYGMLKSLKLPPGESVLINAAGSVLGRQLIELCQHLGYKSLCVVRRREQVQELVDLGASAVICSADEDIVQRVKSLTDGRGAWGALDCIAGEATGVCAASVRDRGTVYVYGVLSGATSTIGVPDLLFRGVIVTGWWLGPYLMDLSGDERTHLFSELWDFFVKGIIKPFVGKSMHLSEAALAVNESLKEARGGKILLK